MEYFEVESNFSPVLSTAISLMRTRGYSKVCDLLELADISVVNTDYDGWNGGTYGYTVYISLPVKTYASLSKELVEDYEKTIGDNLNEAIKGDDNNYFHAQIAPKFTASDIDWELVGGETGKSQLREDLEAMRNIMVAVSTGGPRFNEVDDRYKKLHTSIKQKCKKLNIRYNNTFESTWDWYGKYRSDLPTYQSRRDFVKELLLPTYEAIDNSGSTPGIAIPIVELSDWERINRTLLKIKRESGDAKNEEDFQQIGLLCREVIITLAQTIYSPDIHGTHDDKGTLISKSDAIRMIGNYISVKLPGSSNDELRAYAKVTNKLANNLTHKRDASRSDMLMAVSATIALINLIGILEDKF